MTPPPALDRLGHARVIATIRAPSADAAVAACAALVRGGIRALEITYSTPDAARAIAVALERFGHEVVVGAGTLREPPQVREAADAGAAFLVSPTSEREILDPMVASGICWIAGALTPTEVSHLCRLNAPAVKLFPASVGGPGYLRALRAPMPELRAIPTGGITPGDVQAWLGAGAHAVGAGSELCSRADIAAGRWQTIEAAAQTFAARLPELDEGPDSALGT